MKIVLILTLTIVPLIWGHGRLIEPPSRASAWRYGFNTPHNYNDHELFCGGFTRQWIKNDGKCGICGDPWDIKTPRPHEYGGIYGDGIIVRKYPIGSIINIRVELTANHFGYFEFSICPDYKTTTQKCLNNNILKLFKPQDNVEHNGVRYFPKDGNKIYEIKYKLPNQKCEHCLLQWRYIAGNNWGNCPNGTGAVGCGPQEEFRACADISIIGKALDEEMEISPSFTTISTPIQSTSSITPQYEQYYNPFATLIISLISFLVVFLILFLLYFHFYQVGKQIKNYLKNGSNSTTTANKLSPPMPPPRIKRVQRQQSLSNESLA